MIIAFLEGEEVHHCGDDEGGAQVDKVSRHHQRHLQDSGSEHAMYSGVREVFLFRQNL